MVSISLKDIFNCRFFEQLATDLSDYSDEKVVFEVTLRRAGKVCNFPRVLVKTITAEY